MSDFAPWEAAPIDRTYMPPSAAASAVDDGAADHPLTIRGRRAAAPPAADAQPSPVQGAGISPDAPWEAAPIDTSAAGPSWLDTAKDVAQSAATGVEKGAIGLATLPAQSENSYMGRPAG